MRKGWSVSNGQGVQGMETEEKKEKNSSGERPRANIGQANWTKIGGVFGQRRLSRGPAMIGLSMSACKRVPPCFQLAVLMWAVKERSEKEMWYGRCMSEGGLNEEIHSKPSSMSGRGSGS